MAEQNRIKKEHLLGLLDKGMVMLHLDAGHNGVSVPDQFAGDPHLRLNMSYRFRPCDIEMDQDCVQMTLTFGGTPWLCRLPFTAIFGMTSHVSGESLLWLEDVPEEVLFSIMSSESTWSTVEEGWSKVEEGWSKVEDGEPVSSQGPEMQHAMGLGKNPQEIRRGHLRLVK